jgi:uncharacterized FlgJ-related protein
LVKKDAFEKNSTEKAILMGHPDIHRMIKDLVKFEAETQKKLVFTKKLATVIKANMDAVLKSRAVFVIIEMLAHENSKAVIFDELIKIKKDIQKMYKLTPKSKGLQILLEKL